MIKITTVPIHLTDEKTPNKNYEGKLIIYFFFYNLPLRFFMLNGKKKCKSSVLKSYFKFLHENL